MPCGYCSEIDGTPKIKDFPEIDHPVNTEGGEATYLGGQLERQVYKCGLCGEYFLKITIRAISTGKVLSETVKAVGMNPKGIKADK
jgi:hypothetical protein